MKKNLKKVLLIGLILLTCCTACADSSKNHIDDIAGSEIENENHIDDIAETETESENPSQVEASEEEQIDEEEYNLDEYAELDILEEKFENSDGDVVMTMAVSHLTFTDPKYEKVNAALESIEEAYMEETRSYCKEQAPEMELDMSIENENCRVEEYQWYFVRLCYVGEDYVSILYNDTVYWPGTAHPQSYFAPITIDVKTGAVVTDEEVLGCSWEDISSKIKDSVQESYSDKGAFEQDYGFYLTKNNLVYKYRFSYHVDEIVLER